VGCAGKRYQVLTVAVRKGPIQRKEHGLRRHEGVLKLQLDAASREEAELAPLLQAEGERGWGSGIAE
jgi:hypothetical protein